MQVIEEKSVGPAEIKVDTLVKLEPAQIMANLTQGPNAIVIRQEVQDALAKFGHKSITKSELGPLVGMNEEEMKKLDLFWEPAFNKGWIYLADDMIKMQLTSETGKNAIANFYDKVLLTKDYVANVDYKQINQKDPLVDLCFKSYSLIQGIRNTSNRKLYYAVTGETYKDLLSRASTEGGRSARLLFRKVEVAARLMYDYINALHAILSQQKIEEEKALRLDAESKMIKLEEEKRGPKEYPTEWFYIATCDVMAKSRAYKFGIVSKNNTPTRRLTSYECGYTDYCALDYVYCTKTKCARGVEDAFRRIVTDYLKTPRTDVVLLSLASCIKIADSLISTISDNISHLINMEQTFSYLGPEPKPVYIRGEDSTIREDAKESLPRLGIPPCPLCQRIYKLAGPREKHVQSCGKQEKVAPKAPRKSARLIVKVNDEAKNGILMLAMTSAGH